METLMAHLLSGIRPMTTQIKNRRAGACRPDLSGWKSIAVFLYDTPEGEKIGECAAELAHRCAAHLIGIHGMSSHPAERPSDSFACGTQAIRSVIARLRAAEERSLLRS